MKKYSDYQKDTSSDNLTEDELNSIDWTRFKIVVQREDDRDELMEAFKAIHDSRDLDLNAITLNQLAHQYLEGSDIVVSPELYQSASNTDET